MTNKFIPNGDRVLVKRTRPVEKSNSGIYIPESQREQSPLCEVVAVGPGARDSTGDYMPIQFKPGDKVIVPLLLGTIVNVDKEQYTLVSEGEILGKFV